MGDVIAEAERRGFERGLKLGAKMGVRVGWSNAVTAYRRHLEGFRESPGRDLGLLDALTSIACEDACPAIRALGQAKSEPA